MSCIYHAPKAALRTTKQCVPNICKTLYQISVSSKTLLKKACTSPCPLSQQATFLSDVGQNTPCHQQQWWPLILRCRFSTNNFFVLIFFFLKNLKLKLVFLKRVFNLEAICLLQKTQLPITNTNHNKLNPVEKENISFVDGEPNY